MNPITAIQDPRNRMVLQDMAGDPEAAEKVLKRVGDKSTPPNHEPLRFRCNIAGKFSKLVEGGRCRECKKKVRMVEDEE